MFTVSTSSESGSVRGGYHHGNLRAALLAAGRKILDAEGVTALGLRAVARAAEVSPTAVYRHFNDKAALLAAIAADGFRGLAAAMREAADAAADPGDRMAAIGRAYVTFAVANSAVVRLMFGPEIPDKADHPDLSAAGEEAFAVLSGELASTGARDAQSPDAALAAWSLVHGLSTLLIDGQIRPEKLGVEKIDPAELAGRVGRFLVFPG